MIWFTRENSGNQIKVFYFFPRANAWNLHSVGSGGTYLNSISLGTPTFTKRSGTLGTTTPVAFVDAPMPSDLYIWTQSAGLLKCTLYGYYLTGVQGVPTWTQFTKRQPNPLPVFSSVSINTYSSTLGVSRCDLSIQIGSIADKTLPTFGSGLTSLPGGLLWFEPGTKVKQLTST